MANFYLARVWTFTRDGSTEAIRLTEADTSIWTLTRHDGTKVSVRLPQSAYPFPIARVYNERPNGNPTFALLRCEGTLNAGDFNVDMQTKGAAYWQGLYTQYPWIAAHPFIDAPFQPA